jgi:vacuolar-type H+-ATPase subunit D/Vma8
MADFDDIVEELKQKRDELRVQIHLASKEVQEDWSELEGKMEHFTNKAHLGDTGEGVGKALGQLGHELKLGYERIRDAIKD